LFVYLHGFNSSPQSFKVRVLRERLSAMGRGAEVIAPELSHWPERAIETAERALAACEPSTTTLVGSSLGGYYATWLAERHGLRSVLVNPAVRPYELLGQFVGMQTNLYTGASYELTAAHLEQLRALEIGEITHPERYLLLVAMADEVLDSRVTLHKYRGTHQIIDPGGDHGFSDFARHIDAILAFGAGAVSVPRR